MIKPATHPLIDVRTRPSAAGSEASVPKRPVVGGGVAKMIKLGIRPSLAAKRPRPPHADRDLSCAHQIVGLVPGPLAAAVAEDFAGYLVTATGAESSLYRGPTRSCGCREGRWPSGPAQWRSAGRCLAPVGHHRRWLSCDGCRWTPTPSCAQDQDGCRSAPQSSSPRAANRRGKIFLVGAVLTLGNRGLRLCDVVLHIRVPG